ncbi:MAG: MFS transporter [Bacillota bacterium]|nr:MFS transporter [Bacillota bacterium]
MQKFESRNLKGVNNIKTRRRSNLNEKNGTEKQDKLWTVNYILICLVSLFLFMSFDGMIPTLPIYIEIREGLAGSAGLPLAALTLGAILVRPIAGRALDKYGRKTIFFCGLLLFLLPAISYIWMPSAQVLIISRFIQGIGFGIGTTAMFTLASDIIPPGKIGVGMGYFTGTMSLSLAISPAVNSWILSEYSFRTVFILTSIFILAAFAMAIQIKYPAFTQKEQMPKLRLISKSGLKPALVIFFVALNFSTVMSFLSVYAATKGITVVGVFYTAMALTSLIFRPISGYMVDRYRKNGYNLVIIMGIILLITATVIIANISNTYYLVLGGLVYGAGFAFIQPTMLALSVRNLPIEQRGVANATYWTALDFGVFLGAVTLGFLAASLGYHIMFYVTIIPLIIAFFAYFLYDSLSSKIGKDDSK